MALGHRMGCHQMPERSFFIRGRQFPLCARCTGLLVGDVLALSLAAFVTPPFPLCVLFCAAMFLDWFVQYLELRPSTNLRRLVTGTLCGYGLTSVYLQVLRWCWVRLTRGW